MKFFASLKNELNKITVLRSIKIRVFISIVLTGVLCCFIMRFAIIHNYFQRDVSARIQGIQKQMIIISDHLLTENFLSNQSSASVKAELEQIANLYNGRILIIDNSCKVKYDTYNVFEERYLIDDDAIRGLKGELIAEYDNDNECIRISIPIRKKNEDKTETVLGAVYIRVSVGSLLESQELLNRQIVIMIIIVLIFVVAAAIAIPYYIFRPFDHLTSAINDIKAGFSDERITIKDTVETSHIVDAFNQMMDRMKIVDDSRNEFVSNVSHELKTPLTSIKVLADSLNTMEGAPIEMYQEFMSDIVDEVDRETKIVNDLLSLVKMDKTDKGDNNLNVVQTDINELINSIFKRLGPIAKQQKIDLIFESEREVTAEVDEVKLTLALTNLIENGIKYNHENGYVKVNLNSDHHDFIVTVEDSGIGIDEDEQKHIYDRFYRVDKSHSTQISGTGLGLAITRSAILRHRGIITVDSVLGEGTTFTVKIPLTFVKQ